MTVQEAISTFRLKLGATSAWEDDTQLSDQAIFKLISDSAAVVFSRYREKFYRISPWMYNKYGVKIQAVDEDFFPCEDIERCHVLQSVFEIPEPLMARHKPVFKVFNGHDELPEYSISNKYDDYLKNKPSWEITNNYLRIHNNKVLKAVTIQTIAADATAWVDKKYCPETDTVECFDLSEISMPILNDAKFSNMVYDLAFQSLGLTLNQLQTEPNQNASH